MCNAVHDYRRAVRFGVIRHGLMTKRRRPKGWTLTKKETKELVNFLFGEGLMVVNQVANLNLEVDAVLAKLEPEAWREIREIIRHRKIYETRQSPGSVCLRRRNSMKGKTATVAAYSTGT